MLKKQNAKVLIGISNEQRNQMANVPVEAPKTRIGRVEKRNEILERRVLHLEQEIGEVKKRIEVLERKEEENERKMES